MSYDEQVLYDAMQINTGYHRSSNCTWLAGFSYFDERKKNWWIIAGEAIIQIEWFGGEPPPNVRHGMQVFIMGRLLTYNAGRIVTIHDAVAIKRNGAQLREDMKALMRKYVLNPQGYLKPEAIKRERERNAKKTTPRPPQRLSVPSARGVREPRTQSNVPERVQQRKTSVPAGSRDRLSQYEEP